MEPIPNFNMIIIHFLTRQSLYVSPVVKRGLDVFLKQFKYTSSEKYMYILFLNYKKPKKYINTHYPFYTFAKAALNSNINLVLNIDSNSSHKHEICHNFRIIHILNLHFLPSSDAFTNSRTSITPHNATYERFSRIGVVYLPSRSPRLIINGKIQPKQSINRANSFRKIKTLGKEPKGIYMLYIMRKNGAFSERGARKKAIQSKGGKNKCVLGLFRVLCLFWLLGCRRKCFFCCC